MSLGSISERRLGIAVEHHFVMADLSVWIDDQSSYSHTLRGALRKRVVLFTGVDGYLSDVVQLNREGMTYVCTFCLRTVPTMNRKAYLGHLRLAVNNYVP